MIVTVASQHGAGKTTLVKTLAEHLPDLRPIVMGDKFRAEAEERSMTIEAFMSFLLQNEKESEIFDRKVDDWLIAELKKGNVIVDSSIGPYLAPKDSLNIFLKCELNERAKRVFEGTPRARDSPVESVDQVKQNLMERDENDQKRYLRLYNYDIFDDDNYVLVIDTTELQSEDVVKMVLEAIK